MADRDDQPRWPRGTPVAPGGRGPGGGRFRGADWAAQAAARFDNHVSAYIGQRGELLGQAGGSQGVVFFLQYPDGRKLARKAFFAGGRSEWAEREADAAVVASVIGAPVPEAVMDSPGSLLMEYIDGSTASQLMLTTDDLLGLDPAGMRRLALLDMLIGNNDRHASNVMLDQDGRVWGIDHAFAFSAPWFLSPEALHEAGYRSAHLDELTPTASAVRGHGYGRLIVDEIYDEDAQPARRSVVTGYRQTEFTRAELEYVRQALLSLEDQVDPHRLAGMLRVLDLLVSITPL